jgi:hypothetical protein
MITKTLYVAVCLLVLINMGWVALNIHSEPYIPVPADKVRLENGEVFVHVNWCYGGGVLGVPMVSAVLGVLVITLLALPKSKHSAPAGLVSPGNSSS